MSNASGYIGRFAPSPSGPLHFGSLVAALASYLDARHNNGQWLLRMDDIDPPREAPGAADTILHQLEAHNLLWDQQVLYQSKRLNAYREALEQLKDRQLAYPCDCSRQAIRIMKNGRYNGHCRHRSHPPAGDASYRLHVKTALDIEFLDLFQGHQCFAFQADGSDDFIIRRRDKLFAYQLACSVDELHQNITHIIRGSDLLDSSPRQVYLMQQLLSFTSRPFSIPEYGHIPVAINMDGQKLSKQNLTQAIDPARPAKNLQLALRWLNHPPPAQLDGVPPGELLEWASQKWCRGNIQPVLTVPAPEQASGQ